MMEEELARCRREIETELGWGPASGWSTADFQTLAERIGERSGVVLSATTLKRVWGRVAYKSSPSPTTLDALAQYLGYENWRAYESEPVAPLPPPPAQPSPTNTHARSSYGRLTVAALLVLAIVAGYFLITAAPATPPNTPITASSPDIKPADYTFHHRPVTNGLPNSVIFNYDASAAPVDSVYIQQSWDRRRRVKVDRSGNVHTSIYYLPGYYRATLHIGQREVRSRELLIPSDGWALAVGEREVPIYLSETEQRTGESLAVTPEQLAELGLSLQPEPPTVWLSNVGEFEGVATDAFHFETRLRQLYGQGAGACRQSRVLLLLRNSALIVPLSSAGCVSDLYLLAGGRDYSGKTNDLSAFGVLNGDWVDLRISGQGNLISFYLNDELAMQVESRDEARDILGVRYEFAGGGAVDYVKLASENGDTWAEEFEGVVDSK